MLIFVLFWCQGSCTGQSRSKQPPFIAEAWSPSGERGVEGEKCLLIAACLAVCSVWGSKENVCKMFISVSRISALWINFSF